MNSEVTTPKRHGNKQIDPESETMIYQGVTLSQACYIFSMDLRDLKGKIHGRVKPCGERRQNPIYQIRDLAPYLVKPAYDMDEFISRMTKADLPMMVTKEFWAGQRSRQLFEMAAAELWPTEKVVEAITTLFKTIRMSLLLTRERVERETELSTRQREIVTSLIDNALEDAYEKTTAAFPVKGEPDNDTAVTDQGDEDL